MRELGCNSGAGQVEGGGSFGGHLGRLLRDEGEVSQVRSRGQGPS